MGRDSLGAVLVSAELCFDLEARVLDYLLLVPVEFFLYCSGWRRLSFKGLSFRHGWILAQLVASVYMWFLSELAVLLSDSSA